MRGIRHGSGHIPCTSTSLLSLPRAVTNTTFGQKKFPHHSPSSTVPFMAMRIQSNHFGSAECANDAFTTFSPVDLHLDKWPTFDNPSFVNPSFTIPPFLFTQGSVERFGQVTPPEELSPAVPPSVPPPFREARHGSIPVEELMGDALFPDHQLQALQDFQPPQQQQQQNTFF